MPKRDPIKEAMDRIARCKGAPTAPEAVAIYQDTINSSMNLAVARAAQAAAEHGILDLVPDLVNAFHRFMKKPTRSDKGCSGKTAIVTALDEMEYADRDLFWTGLHHTQVEAAYGGPVDVAAGLRARSAAALVRLRHPDALRAIAALCYDDWPEARHGAVRAAAYEGSDGAELLLRAKALSGDKDPTVTGECLSALMQIAPTESTGFVADFLGTEDAAIAEQAALALGESHLLKAFDHLRQAWITAGDGRRQLLVLPIALLRLDESFAFLLEIITSAPRALQAEAIRAAEIYRTSPDRFDQIQQAVGEAGDPELARLL